MIDKLKLIDWKLLLCFLLLVLSGLSVQYSAAGGDVRPWALHQAIMIIIFLPLFFIIIIADRNVLFNYAYLLFIISISLLLLVKSIGVTRMGATRWIHVFGVVIQPSELVKIAIILQLSRYLTNYQTHQTLIGFLSLVFIMAIPVLLTLLQPSLGSSIIMIIIIASLLFAAGLDKKYFIFAMITCLITGPLIWQSLHDYQKSRILIFLDPSQDPLGAGYNILQSEIAIGAGGMFGKGFLQGSQTQLRFLPEKHTDFAFAVFTEEHGFFKTLLFFSLYFYLIIKCLIIAKQSYDNFYRLVAVGISTFFSSHFFINIGMVTGLLPVVGIPLPFLSYGGSIMLAAILCFGLLLNIDINNKRYLLYAAHG